MRDKKADARVARLELLLKIESKALQSADFAALDAISAEKAALTESLEADLPAEGDLTGLRVQAAANAALFRASLKGVKSAQNRLVELKTARESLNVYTAQGQKAQVIGRRGGVERKA